jgi:thiamine-phosphate pyrophosphorylase
MNRPDRNALRKMLRLYLVTDSAACLGRALPDVVEAAVQGGVGCVQLREKQLDTRCFTEMAIALKERLAPHGVALVINDRIDVALACQADGVHLGQSDMPVAIARGLLPPQVFIGLSVETPQQAQEAAALEVDYLGVSPVFATSTKTDTGTPWGLDGLRRLRASTPLPLVAIGGIQLSNAQQVLDAGADSLAVVSAICSAPSPQEAAGRLRAVFNLLDENIGAQA